VRVLDLFSGIGGFSLGLERAGMETVAFCEIEDYPRRVLAKHWPDVPIHKDIRELDGEQYRGTVDLICGGYPCQPFSTAGKRAGQEDDRHLWPEYLRLIREIRPRWIIGENVAGHISMGLDDVLADMEGEGYAWEAFVIPACAVDAKHRRDRVWIVARDTDCRNVGTERDIQKRQRIESSRVCEDVADTKSSRQQPSRRGGNGTLQRKNGSQDIDDRCATMANTASGRQPGPGQSFNTGNQAAAGKGQTVDVINVSEREIWPTEPAVGRVANGIPSRVDRLKGLGNAVVPQIPEIIGRAIMEIEHG